MKGMRFAPPLRSVRSRTEWCGGGAEKCVHRIQLHRFRGVPTLWGKPVRRLSLIDAQFSGVMNLLARGSHRDNPRRSGKAVRSSTPAVTALTSPVILISSSDGLLS